MRNVLVFAAAALMVGSPLGSAEQPEDPCSVLESATVGQPLTLSMTTTVKINTTPQHPKLSGADFEAIVDNALASLRKEIMAKYGACFPD
jgi:hypothetical protein